jgi:phosphoribosylglycinamide formyltransferase-1
MTQDNFGHEPKRLGVLLSGRGSNFLAIADSVLAGKLEGKAEIACVISNMEGAGGLAAAGGLEFPTACFPSKGRKRVDQEAEVIACLREYEVDFVILAGYLRLLSPSFVAAFPNRILNIHPSLLPAFPGLDAQTQAFEYGAKVAGCTVHFVDEHLDHGAIILQRSISVMESDDAHSLAERILVEEHIAYPEAVSRVVSGQYKIDGRRYVRMNQSESVK